MNITVAQSRSVASVKPAPHDPSGSVTIGSGQSAINKQPDFASLLTAGPTAHPTEVAATKLPDNAETPQEDGHPSGEKPAQDMAEPFAVAAPQNNASPLRSGFAASLKTGGIAGGETAASQPTALPPMSFEQLNLLAGTTPQKTASADPTMDVRSGISEHAAGSSPQDNTDAGLEVIAATGRSAEKTGTSLVTAAAKVSAAYTHQELPVVAIGQQATASVAYPAAQTAEAADPRLSSPTSGTSPVLSLIATSPEKKWQTESASEQPTLPLRAASTVQARPSASVLQGGLTVERGSSVVSQDSLLAPTDVSEIFSWDSPRTLPAHHIATTPFRADLAPHVARQLGEVMTQAAHKPVEIALSPEELGRVRMSVVTEDGKITVNILAERPDTLDLMRRHIDQLGQTFRSMGYNQISFSFGQGADNGNQTSGGPGGDASGKHPSLAGADSKIQADSDIIQLDHAGTDGIDIRL